MSLLSSLTLKFNFGLIINFNIIIILLLLTYQCQLSPSQSDSFSVVSLGHWCNKRTMCDSSAFLTCQKQECACVKPSTMRFDVSLKKCVVLGNQSWAVSSPILVTKLNLNLAEEYPCVTNAVCTKVGNDKTCVCNNNSRLDPDGSCTSTVSHGGSCIKPSDKCRPGLICIDGLCACEYPLHQVYNSKRSICRSLVNGPCGVMNDDTNSGMSGQQQHMVDCVDNAICAGEVILPSRRKTCECKSGFKGNKNGGCDLKQGESCEYGHGVPKCDSSVPLHCVEGKCSCMDKLQIYNQQLNKCLRPIHWHDN